MIDGLPLDDTELALWRQLSGRQTAPTEPFTEIYLLKPRRAGGTLFAAALGLHAALQDHRRELGPGEIATVGFIAADTKQARQLRNYAGGLIDDSPAIAAKVTGRTRSTITFEHRMQIEIHVASFRSTRGYSFAAVIIDELAYLRDEFSASPDTELIRAVDPGLSNLNGRLFGLSTPHVRRGHLFDMWQAHYGKDGDGVLVLQASAHAQLNPRITQAVIDRAMAKDPEAARAEWFGEFRGDVSQWLNDELIDAALQGRTGGRKHPPVAFVDVSGGRHDASCLALAHREDVGEPAARAPPRLVLDVLEHVKAPHEPSVVVERFCSILKDYKLSKVTGDRYGAEWVSSAFKQRGITYEAAELDKSGIYGEVLAPFAERRVTLLDDRRLVTELRMLERKPRTGGKSDMIDHPPNGHDDAANSCAGALWLADAGKGGGGWFSMEPEVMERVFRNLPRSQYPVGGGRGGGSPL
jgi:hypothetical protein